MRFKKKETAQDVVVSCCILHNMRKIEKQQNHDFREVEFQRQIEIGQNVLHAERNWLGREQFRIQNCLLQTYFH